MVQSQTQVDQNLPDGTNPISKEIRSKPDGAEEDLQGEQEQTRWDEANLQGGNNLWANQGWELSLSESRVRTITEQFKGENNLRAIQEREQSLSQSREGTVSERIEAGELSLPPYLRTWFFCIWMWISSQSDNKYSKEFCLMRKFRGGISIYIFSCRKSGEMQSICWILRHSRWGMHFCILWLEFRK